MNSFERYAATIAGKSTDFLPRVPILMQFAAEHIGSNYGAFASDYRVLAEANLRCRAEFGFDQVSCISDPYRETQGFGAEVEYLPDSVPRCLVSPLEASKDLSLLKTPDPLVAERMRDRVEAARALRYIARHEGLTLAPETGAALSYAMKVSKTLPEDDHMILTVSGSGSAELEWLKERLGGSRE